MLDGLMAIVPLIHTANMQIKTMHTKSELTTGIGTTDLRLVRQSTFINKRLYDYLSHYFRGFTMKVLLCFYTEVHIQSFGIDD